MKRGLFLLVFLLTISFASASPIITFDYENIQAGEPIIGKITLNGTYDKEILNGDLRFFEGRRETSFEKDIKFYNGTHYFYIFANREGNFTLKILTTYYENDLLLSEELIKNFTIKTSEVFYTDPENNSITKSKTEVLEIRPALIKETSNDQISIRNLGNESLNLSIGENKINLDPGKFYSLPIQRDEQFKIISIESYRTWEIPVFSNIQIPSGNSLKDYDLRSNPGSLTIKIALGNEAEEIIEIFNFGEENLSNLKITPSTSQIKSSKLSSIGAKISTNITLEIGPREEGTYKEFVRINYEIEGEEYNLTVPINIFVFPVGTNETEFVEVGETCEDIWGSICQIEEKCDGKPRFTKGGDFCCIGICEEMASEEPQKNNNLSIGIGIVLLVALVGLGVYGKVKNKKPKTPEQKLLDRNKAYSKRITGGINRN